MAKLTDHSQRTRLTRTIRLTLKMTSAQVIETSVTNNSSFQNYLTWTIALYELLILLSSNNSLVLFSLVMDCFCPLVLVARKHEAMVPLVKEMSALRGHVIMPLQTNSELECALMCLNTRACFSFNYKTNKQLCELNHTNKFASPHDFIWDRDSTYYEMIFT